jgi:hypothetical protein
MSRLPRRGDDSGASLILALVIVIVIGMVLAAVLSVTDASLRATTAVRGQAFDAASADGAGKIAINALRRGSYDGTIGNCFGADPTLTLSDFYQPSEPSGVPADSAAVTCAPDSALGGLSLVDINRLNRPTNALLTLAAGAEAGVQVDVADGRSVLVHGGVFANSDIAVARGGLSADADVTARGDCSGSVAGVTSPLCRIGSILDPRGDDPNYPAPVADTTVQPVPTCNADGRLLTFTPGLYTDITGLNNLTRCANSILAFPPGTYYFNFGDAIPWRIVDGYVVGGTPTTPLVAGVPPTIPGSCVNPVPPNPAGSWSPPPADSGVTFVFGGGARIVLHSSQVELCGSYSLTGPPIAVYGLTSAVDPVPAQSGCTITGPYPGTGCAVITAEDQANSRFYVQGTAYLPKAALDLAANNPSGQLFSAGVVARTVVLAPTAGAALTGPVIGIPDYVPIGRRTVVTLSVYLCPGVSTCSPGTGQLRLRAKVGILDPSGIPLPGNRQITVYSWSVQR